ncbi:MAG: HoxN/HupN/NixA family nickel/cobalt transporter [Acetobacteraceae bacterium]
MRLKIFAIYALLLTGTLLAWLAALLSFRHHPMLLGTALLAYGLGLRHALDADHIAAIDNVTRKLMQEGKRPAAVGFFFSLGHSTVIVIAAVALAATAMSFKGQFDALRAVGGVVSTLVSALFLFAIAVMNILILASVYRSFRRVVAGERYENGDLDALLAGRGVLARLYRPLFGMIRRSWHMYPLGLLFGLGFETATEVGLLGIAAAEAAQGMPIWSILIFPALFTLGMSLLDSTDGILMLGAYGWAFLRPMRKLYYNLTITLLSVIAALLVGGIEACGLIATELGLHGPLWDGIRALNQHFGALGILIVGLFVGGWLLSAAIYRLRGYHRLELEA